MKLTAMLQPQYDWPYKLPDNLKTRLMVQRLRGCSLDGRYVYHCTKGCHSGRKFKLDARCPHADDRVKCKGFFECKLCHQCKYGLDDADVFL